MPHGEETVHTHIYIYRERDIDIVPHITVWGSCFSLGSRRSPPFAAAPPHSSLTHSLTFCTEPPHFPFAWQAQYTELPGGACGAVAAAGPRLPFAWQAAVHRHRAWRGRRNTQSSTAHHKSSQLHFWQVHFSSQLITSQLITSQLITVPLVTPHFSQLPYHITTSHHTLSQLIPSQVHFSHPFSHLTYHIRTHHSSTSHTWHHKSTSHTSLLTSPKFTLKSYIHKGLDMWGYPVLLFWWFLMVFAHPSYTYKSLLMGLMNISQYGGFLKWWHPKSSKSLDLCSIL